MVSPPLEGGAATPPDPSADRIPTWGYAVGQSRIFNLRVGEALPPDWYASPTLIPGAVVDEAGTLVKEATVEAAAEAAEAEAEPSKKRGRKPKDDAPE